MHQPTTAPPTRVAKHQHGEAPRCRPCQCAAIATRHISRADRGARRRGHHAGRALPQKTQRIGEHHRQSRAEIGDDAGRCESTRGQFGLPTPKQPRSRKPPPIVGKLHCTCRPQLGRQHGCVGLPSQSHPSASSAANRAATTASGHTGLKWHPLCRWPSQQHVEPPYTPRAHAAQLFTHERVHAPSHACAPRNPSSALCHELALSASCTMSL